MTTQVMANSITAVVDIDPDSLHLKSNGRWITAYIGLPEDYDVNNIDVSSIILTNEEMSRQVHVSKHDVQGDVLMVRFNRAEVIIWLLEATNAHMAPHVKHQTTLKVMGSLYDGDLFEGSDTIKVFLTQS